MVLEHLVSAGLAEGEELLAKLDAAGARSAADAIRNRGAAGAVFTHQQKVDVWNVIHDWLGYATTDELGEIMALREALELDLEWHRENGPKRLSLIALNGGRIVLYCGDPAGRAGSLSTAVSMVLCVSFARCPPSVWAPNGPQNRLM